VTAPCGSAGQKGEIQRVDRRPNSMWKRMDETVKSKKSDSASAGGDTGKQ